MLKSFYFNLTMPKSYEHSSKIGIFDYKKGY